jgi:hypothetical protein
MRGTSLPINKGVICSSDIFPDSAVAAFLIPQFTESGTELAFDFSIGMFFIKTGFDFGEVGFLGESMHLGEHGSQSRAGQRAGSSGGLQEIPSVHFTILLP